MDMARLIDRVMTISCARAVPEATPGIGSYIPPSTG